MYNTYIDFTNFFSNSGMMTIHPQSIGLQHVLESVTILKQILQVCRGMDEDELNTETKEMMKSVRGETNLLKMDTQWKELQQNIDHVLDRDMNKGSKGNTWGFKQVIRAIYSAICLLFHMQYYLLLVSRNFFINLKIGN